MPKGAPPPPPHPLGFEAIPGVGPALHMPSLEGEEAASSPRHSSEKPFFIIAAPAALPDRLDQVTDPFVFRTQSIVLPSFSPFSSSPGSWAKSSSPSSTGPVLLTKEHRKCHSQPHVQTLCSVFINFQAPGSSSQPLLLFS